MVGDAALRKVVGADALAAVAAADLQLASPAPARPRALAVCASSSIALSRFIALSRLACWLRRSGISTTTPLRHVGDADRRSVLLTCWPPAPEERNVSTLQVGRIDLDLVDLASSSAMIATVAAEVWMRPCDSVSGTRCTRWVPDSNFSLRIRAAALDARDDFLVAAMFAGAGRLALRPASPGVRRSARTCGTGRRRRSPPRRRRCRRALPGRGCLRRADPSAAAVRHAVRRRVSAGAPAPAAISSSASSRSSGSSRIASARGEVALARRSFRRQRGGDRFELRELARQGAEARRCRRSRRGSASRRSSSSWRSAQRFELAAQAGDHGPNRRNGQSCGPRGVSRRLASMPSRRGRREQSSGARARSLSPSSAASRSAIVGACSSRLVSVCARKSQHVRRGSSPAGQLLPRLGQHVVARALRRARAGA